MLNLMCKLPAWIFTVLLFCLSFPLHAEQLELEVITLKYRTAQDVLPVVQPLVNQAGGTVSGTQNRLIVRTTRANLDEVRRILAGIDTLPRRLQVTVKQDAGQSAMQRSTEVSGNAAVGNNAQVIIPPSGRDGRGLVIQRQQSGNSVRAQVQGSESRGNENNVQQLQVLEGNEAFIGARQLVPAQQQTIIQTPQGPQVVQNTQFRDTTSGFYVRPRVSGEQVTLEVRPQRERLGPDGSIDTQIVSTVVSGRLGEWMELGGIDQSRAQQNSAIASRDSERNSDQRRIYIKVEEMR